MAIKARPSPSPATPGQHLALTLRVVDQPFTIFVFVSLNNQRTPGSGQTHVLKGGHIAMEEFFNWQTTTFGKAGSVCEGWSTEADG